MSQILKTFQILTNGPDSDVIKTVISQKLITRGMVEASDSQFTLTVTVDPSYKADSFWITGKPHSICITADTLSTAFAGCGRFLYLSSFQDGGIIPTTQRGKTSFDCSFRCVYAASHFHTFYYTAPLEEVFAYVEDLALMGINLLCHSIPGINLNIKQTAAMEAAYTRCSAILKKAKSLGMKILMGGTTSCTFLDIPEELKAVPIPQPMGRRGNAGHKVCPSKPEGQKLLDKQNHMVMQAWKSRGVEIDYVSFFPYDEGGCGCEKCHPWGARGYIKACKRACEVIREIYPNCKFVVSTWLFDIPDEGEWDALSASLAEEKWADVIEADSHTEYPRYPIDVQIPGNLTLVAFPEISMWGLWPWGGYGASFFPKRYTDIWRKTEGKLSGGRMYSEGIFEDLNKYVVSGLYRSFNNDPDQAVYEYAGFSFGCTNRAAFVEMVDCIEKNTILNASKASLKVFLTAEMNNSDLSLAKRAWELAQEIDRSLPEWGQKSWRWRLLYIRAFLDLCRYQNQALHENPEAVTYMNELMDIYHCLKDYKLDMDPYHLKLRPPIPVYDTKEAVDRHSHIGSIRNAAAIGLIKTEQPLSDLKAGSGDEA